MCITNENDIFAYFDVINDICPASVIDVGMFLKRIGGVSRQARGVEISRDIKLDGIDIFPDINPKVFNVIYDEIYDMSLLETSNKYDLMIMLRTDSFIAGREAEKIWNWAKQNVKYVFTSCEAEYELEELKKKGKVRDIRLENELYAVVIF